MHTLHFVFADSTSTTPAPPRLLSPKKIFLLFTYYVPTFSTTQTRYHQKKIQAHLPEIKNEPDFSGSIGFSCATRTPEHGDQVCSYISSRKLISQHCKLFMLTRVYVKSAKPAYPTPLQISRLSVAVHARKTDLNAEAADSISLGVVIRPACCCGCRPPFLPSGALSADGDPVIVVEAAVTGVVDEIAPEMSSMTVRLPPLMPSGSSEPEFGWFVRLKLCG